MQEESKTLALDMTDVWGHRQSLPLDKLTLDDLTVRRERIRHADTVTLTNGVDTVTLKKRY